MKKTVTIITAILLVISLIGTAYAMEEVTESPAEYLGTYEYSATEAVASRTISSSEIDTAENVIENVTVPAVEIEGEYNLSTLIRSPEAEAVPYAFTSFSFDGLAGQSMASNWITYVIEESGDTVLNVKSCTWIPSRYEIVIGFYNQDTNKLYGVEYVNTTVTNVNITTQNVPAGNYYIVVRNEEASNLIIGDGIISYNIS